MPLNDYKEDTKKQEKGSPCYIDVSGAYVNVQRAHTPIYNKQIEAIKLELYGFDHGDIDHNEVIANWLAEYGVTGWGGLLHEGEELKFNKRNARLVFKNEAYYLSLNQKLANHAINYSNYLYDLIEEDIENIKKS